MAVKNKNLDKTLGARCNFVVTTKKLSPKQKDLIKIIVDYKKAVGAYDK